MKNILTMVLALASVTSSACIKGLDHDGIVPKNNLIIPVRIGLQTGISKKSFDSIIKRAQKKYSPVISAMGGRLVIKKKWRDGTVNAYAEKKGSRRIVTMFGGFARHHLVTEDVFMFVVCHELGHHVGGEPMIRNVREVWASNEGQSDYFAGMKCMRKLLVNENNVSIMSNVEVPELVKQRCDVSFNDENNQALCQRVSMAGYGLASVFRDLRKSEVIDFTTPDLDVVWRTWFLHPVPQCRLDTYFASATCPISYNVDISYDDENVGLCTRKDNQDDGARPLCWFAPDKI